MKAGTTRNFHVPLSETVYDRLKSESLRTKRPATVLAREAIEAWLSDQERFVIKEALGAYARSAAGTTEDLDPVLERAGVDHLLNSERKPRRR